MSLTLDLSKFAMRSEAKMKQVAMKTTIDLSQAVIADTPVDTGVLKNSWFPSINGYDESVTDKADKSGTIANRRVETKFSGYKLGDTMTMSNNLAYAYPIEFLGHSKTKAPVGMVRVNITKFQAFVDKNLRGLS